MYESYGLTVGLSIRGEILFPILWSHYRASWRDIISARGDRSASR